MPNNEAQRVFATRRLAGVAPAFFSSALLGAALLGVALLGVVPLAAVACLSDAQANAQPNGPPDLYVDGLKGGDDYAVPARCGSKRHPCKFPNYAISIAGPGTTVHLAPTAVYTDPIYIANQKGALGRPIVIRGDGVAPALSRIAIAGTGNGIMLDGASDGSNRLPAEADACVAYFTIQNLDIQAVGHQGGRYPAPYVGVFVQNAHHVQVLDNRVHDSGGTGIGTVLADWITIERNQVFGNSLDTSGGIYTSGISLYQNKDHLSSDPNTVGKISIVGNVVHHNRNGKPPVDCEVEGIACQNSDGNGIIIDDSRHSQPAGSPLGATLPAYRGFTNIYNNVVFANGAAGIATYQSEHVAIVGNTALNDMQDIRNDAPNKGEISANDSADIRIWSNLAVSDGRGGGGRRLPADGRSHYAISSTNPYFVGAANVVDANATWNPLADARLSVYVSPQPAKPTVVGLHNRFADPRLVDTRIGGEHAAAPDLRVHAGSAALGFVGLADGMYAARDILFDPRPSVTATGTPPSVTAGAYQRPVP